MGRGVRNSPGFASGRADTGLVKNKRTGPYQADPATRQTPVRLDELEALSLSVGDLSSEQAAHLVSRVMATIKEQRRRMAELQTEIEKMAVRNAGQQHPIQKALDAISALDSEQLASVLDVGYLAAVEELEKEKLEGEKTRIGMQSETNRTRFALAQLLEDPELTVPLRERLQQILAQLPRW